MECSARALADYLSPMVNNEVADGRYMYYSDVEILLD